MPYFVTFSTTGLGQCGSVGQYGSVVQRVANAGCNRKRSMQIAECNRSSLDDQLCNWNRNNLDDLFCNWNRNNLDDLFCKWNINNLDDIFCNWNRNI